MRESLLRRYGPERYSDLRPQPNTKIDPRSGSRTPVRVQVSRIVDALAILLLLPATLLAQSPWERAAANLERTFTGPIARSLALVAIVIGGLMFMFGEGGAKREIAGIVFGGGLALFAAQFLTWLF